MSTDSIMIFCCLKQDDGEAMKPIAMMTCLMMLA